MREQIFQGMESKRELPPLPDVLVKLESRINDPDFDVEEIASLIETEPVLSGRLIKMANSVFYSAGREPVEDISESILRLGIKMVLDLAYALQLPELLHKFRAIDQLRFWKHSLAVGFLTHHLGEMVLPSREEVEVGYLSGLMHDVGILVFNYLIPEDYEDFLLHVADSEESLDRLEEKRFGLAHPELGAEFIERHWPVSEKVIHAVRVHHIPAAEEVAPFEICQVVRRANQIANYFQIGHGLTRHPAPALEPEVLNTLGITEDDLDQIREKVLHSLGHAEELLQGTASR